MGISDLKIYLLLRDIKIKIKLMADSKFTQSGFKYPESIYGKKFKF